MIIYSYVIYLTIFEYINFHDSLLLNDYIAYNDLFIYYDYIVGK